jgi:S-DNA-T family DNA segregation ATPase FtsK/SpoIIIE
VGIMAFTLGTLLLLGLLSLRLPLDAGWWVRAAFGFAGWVIPPLLMALGLYMLLPFPPVTPKLGRETMLGAAMILLAALGLLHLPAAGDPWVVADAGGGGGYVGAAMVFALSLVMGRAASAVVLSALAAVGLVLAFSVSPLAVLARLVKVLVVSGRRVLGRLRRPKGSHKPRLRPAVPVGVSTPQLPEVTAEPDLDEAVQAEPVSPEEVAPAEGWGSWRLPPYDLLDSAPQAEVSRAEMAQKARIIEETLAHFNVQAWVREFHTGPAVTQFALEPAPGVKVSRIASLANDLALALAAPSIRIEAPIPGQPRLGIEIPNPNITVVGLKDVLESSSFQRFRGRLKLALGRDVAGQPVVADLTRMPHLLIAGATGSGKSVCINSIVACLLFQMSPEDLRFIMIDPKMVELTLYNGIPHLLAPVVTELDRVVPVLRWALKEMNRRYRLFKDLSVRNLESYNLLRSERTELEHLPYLVIIIDELADLMMSAPQDVEAAICRLAQMARATGIHLVVATQRPSVDVVTGLIKANFPSRISFAVTSQVDSRVILDMAGAERLLGRGDMLFTSADRVKPARVQGTYVSDREVTALVEFWKAQAPEARYNEELVDLLTGEVEEETDELLPDAIRLAERLGRISPSLLQRRLRIGHSRALKLIALMEARGILALQEDGRGHEVISLNAEAEDAGFQGQGV